MLKNGNLAHSHTVLTSLDFPLESPEEKAEWVKVTQDSTSFQLQAMTLNETLIPDVHGMGARDAVYLLEKSGLRINLTGAGKVVSQSFRPGQKLIKGTTITITLR